eukprot:2296736-Amphidinium_carterae.3
MIVAVLFLLGYATVSLWGEAREVEKHFGKARCTPIQPPVQPSHCADTFEILVSAGWHGGRPCFVVQVPQWLQGP